MKRCVCYSLLLQNAELRPILLAQIAASVKSLRTHNRSVPVHAFVYGDEPELAGILAPYDVTIHDQGSYEDRLDRSLHHGAEVFSRYPVLHKLLNFEEISALAPSQVLLLDCDTMFFADVNVLFERYSKADCYAREEPFCKRSVLGYDPHDVDEELLAVIASSEAISAPPPFNLGVTLLNNQLWRRMPPDSLLLYYVWRFAVWMALNRGRGASAIAGSEIGADYFCAQIQQFVSNDDIRKSLQYPSQNRWIVDQFALWLTFAHIPNFAYEDFRKQDVIQGSEFAANLMQPCDWILCHYFTGNTKAFDSWVRKFMPSIGIGPTIINR
ncbi:MAG TPA: hypothetical protein VIH72_13185 [Candidatus Acidoferrales bacterium]|jgi:hypothetical protein